MIRELFRAILHVFFGDRAIENTSDWYEAHKKTEASRQELEQAVQEAENNKKG